MFQLLVLYREGTRWLPTLRDAEMLMLEGAKATTETVDAVRTGAAAMKVMQKARYVGTHPCSEQQQQLLQQAEAL
ncbi:vacuolar protein sorting-associated protein 32 homolog 1-like [Miscanthus floridulus]|uniref:vacuolar protein sorting-associated protein 32 homolog 1-like n=1 Tax=Miscanthus floridulus TaxID=154761 RepID=UPI0034590643